MRYNLVGAIIVFNLCFGFCQPALEVTSVTYYSPSRYTNGQWVPNGDGWIDIYEDGQEPNGTVKLISGNGKKTEAWTKLGVQKPVAYASGYAPRLSAEFNITNPDDDCNINSTLFFARAVRITPNGPELILPPKQLTIESGVYVYKMTNFEQAFDEGKVYYEESYEIEWQYSTTILLINQEWQSAGVSENPMYITHRVPAKQNTADNKFSITLIHIACSAANGLSEINSIADAIFTEFQSQCVTKKNDPACMKYWGDYSNDENPTNFGACRSLSKFLEEGDARCGEWKDFLVGIWNLHGIKTVSNIQEPLYGSKKRRITAYSAGVVGYVPGVLGGLPDAMDELFSKLADTFGTLFDPNDPFNISKRVYLEGLNVGSEKIYALFYVNNWAFSSGENNFYGRWVNGAFSIQIEDWDGNGPYQSQTISGGDLIGVPAQGNGNPQSFFYDHVVVEYNGKIYDPSYGSVFPNKESWANTNLAGFGTRVFYRDENLLRREIIWLHKNIQSGNNAVFSN